MSNIGADFTFATAGTEDTLYGFSYANLKSAAFESADTDGFLITSALNGDLYYNTGSTLAPSYTKITNFSSASGGVQVRITGIFVNNVKVSGSDPKLYWSPNNIDSSGNVTSAGAGANMNGVTGMFTVEAVDNVDGTFGNGNDTFSGTVGDGDATASVNLTPVNDAPVITSNGGGATASFSVAENTAGTIATVTSTDVDGPGATYSVSGGADSGLFSINPATGVLTFNPAPNFEAPTDAGGDNVYNVTVQVSDGTLTDTQALTITVTDVNETPVNTVPGGTQTADAGRQVTFAGNITVADPDAGTTLTTTLTVANGTLAASGAGVSGSGSNTVVITGSVVDVNAALATVVYTGDLGFSSDSLQVLSSDGALSDTDSIAISAGFPQVMAVTAPADGYYSNEGTALMSFTVQFDQTVVVNTGGGTPSLGLTIGAASVNAAYTGGTGTDTLTFQYTVLDGQNDADGIDIGTISLNGGTIKNGGGADADLDMTGLLPNTTGVLVDTDADVGNDMAVTIVDIDGYIDNSEKGAASFSTSGVDSDATATVTFTSSGGGAPVVYAAAGPGNVAWTVDLSGLSDGTVTASISATDTAGNTDAGTSDTSVLDTTADVGGNIDVIINDGDGYIDNSEKAVVSYTVAGVDGDATAEVTFTDGVTTVTAGLTGNGTSTVNLTALSDGPITAAISVTDTATNTASNATADTSTKDTTADAAPTATLVIDAGNAYINNAEQAAAPFTISGLDADVVTADVYFSDGVNPDVYVNVAAGNGAYTANLSSLNQGLITATLDIADAAGNNATGTGDTVTKDTTADAAPGLTVVINDGDGFIDDSEKAAVSYTVANKDADATATLSFTSSGGAGTVTVNNAVNGITTVDLSSLPDGTITAAISVTDTAGNSANGTGDTSTKDTTADAAPAATVLIDGGDAYINAIEDDATSPFTVTGLDADVATAIVTFSDGVNPGVDVDVSAGDGAYTVNLTGLNQGTITATLAIGDGAGNSATGVGDTVIKDTIAPSITTPATGIALTDAALKDGDSTTLTVVFSEAVTGFTGADVTAPNGSLGALSSGDGGVTWTGSFSPSAATTDATNTIDVAKTGVADLAGNPGVGSASSNNYTVDTVHPTITSFTSTTLNGTYKIGDTVNVTATTSENVKAGATLDVTLDSGATVTLNYATATTLTGSYVIAEGQSSLDLTVSSFTAGTVNDTADATGNALTSTALPGINIADGSAIVVDGVRPVLNTITLDDSALKIGDTATVTFTFSEAVANFSDADVTVDNGSAIAGLASGDGGITWTGTFTPSVTTTDATNVVTVGAAWNDLAGNAPSAGNTSANYTVDTVRPTVAITLIDSVLNSYDTPTVTFTFSEAVQGFTAADVTVANGGIGAVSTSNNIVFTATLTPNASVEDATNVVTVGTGFADMADATGNAPLGSTNSGNYTIDTLIPAPVYTGAVYDVASNSMIISGSNIGTLMSFLGQPGGESYGDDIAANLDFTKLHWDVDGNGSNEYTASGGIGAAYVHDDHTLQILFAGAHVTANPNFGSKAGSAWDNLVIENGFSKDSSGNIATADGATLNILGDLNQAGMPMVFETNFSGVTDLVNETLGLAAVASAAFDASVDTLHIGVSAASVTVAGDVVAGSSTSGSVVMKLIATPANAISLTGGSLTGSLDGSVISFDDGSVLKTNVGARGTLSGDSGNDLLIAGANGDRLLGNAGNDMLLGGAGTDQIYGGAGNDTIYGGAGNDYMVGGSGTDNFVFTGAVGGGNDTIADFLSGTDDITFDSGVVANIGALTIADSGTDLLVTVTATGATIRLLGQAGVDVSGDLTFSAGSFYSDGQDVFA